METKLAEDKEKFRMMILLFSISQVQNWLPETKVFITVEFGRKLIFEARVIRFKKILQ